MRQFALAVFFCTSRVLRSVFLVAFLAIGNLAHAQEVTLTRDELRGAAQQALLVNPAAARDLALILVRVDPEDPVAYRILAAAHFRLGDAELARAGARLAYWRAPIGWSGLIVSALWASGLSGRCSPARADDIPMRYAA